MLTFFLLFLLNNCSMTAPDLRQLLLACAANTTGKTRKAITALLLELKIEVLLMDLSEFFHAALQHRLKEVDCNTLVRGLLAQLQLDNNARFLVIDTGSAVSWFQTAVARFVAAVNSPFLSPIDINQTYQRAIGARNEVAKFELSDEQSETVSATSTTFSQSIAANNGALFAACVASLSVMGPAAIGALLACAQQAVAALSSPVTP